MNIEHASSSTTTTPYYSSASSSSSRPSQTSIPYATLHSEPLDSGKPSHATHHSAKTPSKKDRSKVDKSYGRMPNGGGKEFVPPTPSFGSSSGQAVGGYNPRDRSITIDRGLSKEAGEIVYEHEVAHAAHNTYLSLTTGDLTPDEAEDVAENLLLSELAAFQRQVIMTHQKLAEGWDPIGYKEGSMAAAAELYSKNPGGFRRKVLEMYAKEYQGRFTGLVGKDGKPINLMRIAESILSTYR